MVDKNESLRAACKDFERDLVLYYFDDCAGTKQSRIEMHLESCAPCRRFLEDLQKILPLTVKLDNPPQAFWEDYFKELRAKLAAVEPKRPWWVAFSFLRPWPVPAVATALVLILTITFTLIKDWRGSSQLRPADETLLEVLPIVQNLDFFETMELLNSLEKSGGKQAEDRGV
jgi:hypothetical protein